MMITQAYILMKKINLSITLGTAGRGLLTVKRQLNCSDSLGGHAT